MKKDIFISYRNDGEGNNFAARLKEDLDKAGYSVYFNSHEKIAGEFPLRLKQAIDSCSDLILILSKGCIHQLKQNNAIDWVREELLYAKKNNKNILPILTEKTSMPLKSEMPEKLQFICDLEILAFSEQYLISPFTRLIKMLKAEPSTDELKDISFSNKNYDIHTDFITTKQKAGSGDIESMLKLACQYLYGLISHEDGFCGANYTEASKWLLNIINADTADGQPNLSESRLCAKILLANMYYSGSVTGYEQSFKKTISMLADAGNEAEMSDYSFSASFEKEQFMLTDGIGQKFDYQKILEYYAEHKNCSNNAKNNMAKFYMRYGLYREAVDILESIEDPYPDIEYKLGNIYLYGLHCNPPCPDVFRAEHYFISASNSGHLDATHALGLMHFRGQFGFRQNLKMARNYYFQAASQGHRGAQYDYAWMCKYGLGGERNIPEAIRYFERAAQKGHVLCMAELALVYQEKECQNFQKAFEWAKLAAETGDSSSEFVLGNMYFLGRGCNVDMEKAIIFYKKAFAHGCYQAKFMLEKSQSLFLQDISKKDSRLSENIG